jgi:hypothetical protein
LAQLDEHLEGTPHIVPGFNASLGVSRHVTNAPEFIAALLDNLGTRHDRLLDLVEAVADDDPFVALCLPSMWSSTLWAHH